MITPSFGLTATERVLPRLALDFTIASLDPRVSFTRSGNTATVTNSSGLIAGINANLPRFDFNPITLACKGLLIEESRTNSILQSQNLATTWVKANCTISSDQDVSPDGTQNADKIITNNGVGVGSGQVYQEFSASAGVPYTVSTYLKPAGQTLCALVVNARSTVPSNITFMFINVNLDTGAITNSSNGTFTNVSSTITLAANGYYRVTLTATPPALTATLRFNVTNGVVGDGVNGVFGWGFQGEAGSFATSYIPTTTTALTRNADVATITGTNFSDFWQASKGGAQVQSIPSTVSGIRPLVQYDDGTADNIIALRGNAANPELQIVDGGAPQVQLDAGTIVANTPYSLTGWWQTNDCKARQNSGATVSDYTATIPTVTQARLGSDGTNYLNGHLATINYYDRFSGQIYNRRKNKVFASLL